MFYNITSYYIILYYMLRHYQVHCIVSYYTILDGFPAENVLLSMLNWLPFPRFFHLSVDDCRTSQGSSTKSTNNITHSKQTTTQNNNKQTSQGSSLVPPRWSTWARRTGRASSSQNLSPPPSSCRQVFPLSPVFVWVFFYLGKSWSLRRG